LSTSSGPQWKRIGIQRRTGVVAPLFSVYSRTSCGIGELPDLKLLVEWCLQTGMSIIQLLPMNDTGFCFRPYDAQSSFALEPAYLCLEKLKGIDIALFVAKLQQIKKQFPTGRARVNYGVKAAKLRLLWEIFESAVTGEHKDLDAFIGKNRFWIDDYALFRVIKEEKREAGWEEWPEDLKTRVPETMSAWRATYRRRILFHQWVQWQLHEQFKDAREDARHQNVLLMGDIPFLVSRDSADVWSHQDYFKLEFSAGAPADLLYSRGQRWGMPPFDWDKIAGHKYDYVVEILKYAQNFYDLYRIDHVVGMFRVWSIPLSEPLENEGLNGVFDPKDENVWEQHGRHILSLMVDHADMLACAEDLGTVPPACSRVLKDLGIPGIDVQRWMRDWGKTYDFKAPKDYRSCAIATIATHDLSNLCAWWQFECGTVDEALFRRNCGMKNIPFDSIKKILFDTDSFLHGRLRWRQDMDTEEKFLTVLGISRQDGGMLLDMYKGSFFEKQQFLKSLGTGTAVQEGCPTSFINKALTKIQESSCIFSIQLIQDYFSLDQFYDADPWENRINFPGTLSDKNWTLALSLPLEDIRGLPINSVLKAIHQSAGRIPPEIMSEASRHKP
jgi:4-alpha-glucanotransferase